MVNHPRIKPLSGNPLKKTGEAGIRTLGTLLGYNALAKRRFRPLSHLTWICGGKAIATKPWASNETFAGDRKKRRTLRFRSATFASMK